MVIDHLQKCKRLRFRPDELTHLPALKTMSLIFKDEEGGMVILTCDLEPGMELTIEDTGEEWPQCDC